MDGIDSRLFCSIRIILQLMRLTNDIRLYRSRTYLIYFGPIPFDPIPFGPIPCDPIPFHSVPSDLICFLVCFRLFLDVFLLFVVCAVLGMIYNHQDPQWTLKIKKKITPTLFYVHTPKKHVPPLIFTPRI